MAVTYSTAAKNARLNAVRDLIDAGAGAGKLKIYTAGYATLLGTLTLSDPCAANAASGVLTLNAITSDSSADASGTAVIAKISDSNDTDIITGLTVGTSATDIILNSNVISVGQVIAVTAGSITHAA